jgi:hypothetical protein
MDGVLHAQRTADRTSVEIPDLVDGAMVADDHSAAWLYWQERYLRWTPLGYQTPDRVLDSPIRLLTPQATLATLRAGYRPVIHNTAEVG